MKSSLVLLRHFFAMAVLAATLLGTACSIAAEASPKGAFRVCIDPGHPSENNDGRALLNGTREVEVVWAVSLALQKLLEQDGYVVTMTKATLDEYVTNKRRAEIANEARADLMLRLHADSGGPSGFTIYYPRKPGRVHGVAGPAQAVIESSSKAANALHSAMASELREHLQDNGVKGDEQTYIGAKQGALTGSIYSQVPAVLIEMVNLAKPADAKWIRDPANQQAFARALFAGVAAVAKTSGK
ncbi:MAG TPA: N-acetylmuramoyl-L-alanine amidase [Chthoniobacteraceae bacterium]|jgi:N-acetylmuramoyl-L-alanine amidase